MKAVGLNAIVIDLADAMVFDSHPELAIEGAFTKDEMRAELDRLNALGFEVIPKLNFSATHDEWLGEYSRMLSTEKYYEVCRDLIKETAELFDARLFHIGFDEENFAIQDVNRFEYKRLRTGNAWWNDFLWFVQTENEDLSSYGMSVGASSANSGYFSVAAFIMSTMNGK